MRFLDANVFIYAYYRPGRKLGDKEAQMKEEAKATMVRINSGEETVLTTVVHLSEVANILKRGMTPSQLSAMIMGLYTLDNVEIKGVSSDTYYSATELGSEIGVQPNDALAIEVMRNYDVDEIYSFDKGFDKIPGIRRLP
ncbi:type II toxin-antitoxin system VapC family toxin [Candidatus Bathyarchaeota archaeon]|nr:type II toxin-antitoxin system VapC family toxin [Candidatus Bathyarchaeota archaeon]